MANNNVPDVRVRLSAEGVDEVVQAFQQVQAAAEKAAGQKKSGSSGGGTSLMSAAMADLQSALPTLSIASAVAAMLALEKQAFNSANEINNLAIKTGTSTEMLSVFAFAAKAANVSTEDMGTGLVRLSRSMDQAAQGIALPLDSFKRLGIGMQSIKNDDPGQMFLLLANKLSKVTDGSQKAALAQNLLGRSGASLLPLLQSLAGDGYDQIATKAMRMGVVLDGPTRDAINKADDALADMQNLLMGVATQFLAGFGPQVADGIENAVNSLQGGVKSLKSIGDLLGVLAKIGIAVFASGWEVLATQAETVRNIYKTVFAEIVSGLHGVSAVFDDLRHGNFSDAKFDGSVALSAMASHASQFVSQEKSLYSSLGSSIKGNFTGIFSPASKPNDHRKPPPDSDTQAKINGRLALLKAASQAELAIETTRNTLESQQNDRDYADGLISLTDYYAKRKALIQQAADAEIAALEKQKQDILKSDSALPGLFKQFQANPNKAPTSATPQQLKSLQQLATLQSQIDQKHLQVQGQIKANDDQEANAKKQFGIDDLDIQQKIADLEGNRAKSMQLALDSEIAQETQLLTKHQKDLNLTAQDIANITAQMRAIGEARNNFTLASQQGQQALDDLKLQTDDINRLQSTGAINTLQANAQILQLERDRIATLQDIGKQLTINAQKSGDPQLIQQAKDYNAQIKDLAANLDVVGKALGDMQTQGLSQAKQGFDTFFTDVLSGSKSAKDAWADIATSFRQVVAQMIAKLIELYFWMLLLKFISPASSAGSGGGNAPDLTGNFTAPDGSIPVFGGGGFTGTGATNAIAGFVHGQEYVFDAPAVKSLGVDLLDALRGGAFRPVPVRSASSFSMPSAAALQPLPAGAAGGPGGGTVVNVDTQGQPAQVSQSQLNGQSVIDIVVGHVAADIRKGGQVGQAVQQSFALRRQGVTRG